MSPKTRWALYVLAFLCLSMFTTSASAECAWVLWERITTTSSHAITTWDLVGTYQSESACRGKSAELLDTKFLPKGRATPTTTTVMMCLPDTVDPRSKAAR